MHDAICIVIPVYKPFVSLKDTERISWNQCLSVLSSYTIYLVHPPQLDLSGYDRELSVAKINYNTKSFPAHYFADIFGYNRLLLSYYFFKCFDTYEYMLLYQLDAYIFEDKLIEWCTKGYSYVGAPWFKDFVPPEEEAQLWKVGNGGFTLRRIPDCLRVLKTFSIVRSWKYVAQEHFKRNKAGNKSLKSFLRLIKRIVMGNNTYWRFNDYDYYAPVKQEDYFWGVECAEKFSWYVVPSPKQALEFSFEVHPRKMYELNGFRLPVGCHAWEKYDPKFWKSFIN